MTTELNWLVSTSASALYAARAVAAESPLADKKLAAALDDPTRQLVAVLSAHGVPSEPFFAHAIPGVARFDTPRALAEAIVGRLLPPSTDEGAAESLARQIRAVEQAFALAAPGALAELELRGGPLREQWEARGPGLLATLGRVAEPQLLVEAATVVLVLPLCGGGGLAHPTYNAVSLEAVLTNSRPELPEVVRLGWLLAQLTFDLPRFEDSLPRDMVSRLGPLALIPPVLAAAEEVELARFDLATLSTVLDSWTTDAAVRPQTLVDWWQTYQASRPDFVVALGALAAMIESEPH